jgi:hypothetical protein
MGFAMRSIHRTAGTWREVAMAGPSRLTVNRAPVMTLWAAVVAERLGYRPAEALTLGRAVAGLNAQIKGRRLGIFEATGEPPKARRAAAKRKTAPAGKRVEVELMHRTVPALRTPKGLRALDRDRVVEPETVERYLESKFGDRLPAVRQAMERLAASRAPKQLATEAYELYESFRPSIPAGKRGWGAAGTLDLERIRKLAEQGS